MKGKEIGEEARTEKPRISRAERTDTTIEMTRGQGAKR